MKRILLTLFIFIVILIFIWSGWILFKANATIDIYFHDTYYVIGRKIFVLSVLLILFFYV